MARKRGNMFYDIINKKFCNGKLRSQTDYTDMWKKMNGDKPLDDSSFEKMGSVLSQLPEQRWLRKILSLRWGMVITSAVDGALYQCVGQDFSMQPIDMNWRFFDRKYISKRTLNVSFLYGTIDGINGVYPPKECSHNTFMKERKKINDRIEWIYGNNLKKHSQQALSKGYPFFEKECTTLRESNNCRNEKAVYCDPRSE